VLIVGAMLRFRLKQNRLPLLWIGLAYILLIILAVAAGGALKWLHLTHVAVALALIIAALAAPLPRLGRWSVSVAVCALCAAQCISSLASPFRYYSAVGDALSSVTPDDAPIYLQHRTVLWAVQLNNPANADRFRLLDSGAVPLDGSLYLEQIGWQPAAPSACSAVLWTDGELRLRRQQVRRSLRCHPLTDCAHLVCVTLIMSFSPSAGVSAVKKSRESSS
ncbi:MAG: hypothetical protein IPK19_27275, partial [Chloroflexi bacterium]|nr:hypothetical protein [Chloroflexota bacterium]